MEEQNIQEMEVMEQETEKVSIMQRIKENKGKIIKGVLIAVGAVAGLLFASALIAGGGQDDLNGNDLITDMDDPGGPDDE